MPKWLLPFLLVLSIICVAGAVLPLLYHRHPPANACRNNLYSIAGAKQAWASEHNKSATDVPLDQDLYGTNKYLTHKTKCPSGGAYTLGTVAEKPRCSIPGHKL